MGGVWVARFDSSFRVRLVDLTFVSACCTFHFSSDLLGFWGRWPTKVSVYSYVKIKKCKNWRDFLEKKSVR
jgi:hypothetical protein